MRSSRRIFRFGTIVLGSVDVRVRSATLAGEDARAPSQTAFAKAMGRRLLTAAATALACISSPPDLRAAAPITMAPQIVTATRAPEAPENIAATVRLLDETTLRQTPAVTLDGALRSVPGFSLFRRSDSFIANPSAQGVSLRGLGPSGASRSLVLLDGVPLTDPFGGWVAWTKVPREALSHVEIVPGGGAAAWGNSALGGVVQLFTPIRHDGAVDPPSPSAGGRTPALRFNAQIGDYGTRSAEFDFVAPTGAGTLQLLGRDFGTDGFSLVAPERRGPVDLAAWSRHRWLTARWQHVRPGLEVLGTARVYQEKRGNGTPYQGNGTRETFASLAIAGHPADTLDWNAVGYAQTQRFSSPFGSVNAARTVETPASDQFAVPSTAFGAAWSGGWRDGRGGRTSFGVDGRHVRGETREHFTFANGAFTRLRVAGGRQSIGGVFALHERPLVAGLRGTISARADRWSDRDGHRYETDRTTGAPLRNDVYPNHGGTNFSPSAGLVWSPARAWRLRANAQEGFRRPTINELYRPFRVGPTVTESNPDLRNERVTSGEIGAEWTWFAERRPPAGAEAAASGSVPALTLGATGFTNELRDAVANVTLVRGPGTYPNFGFIAAGGVGRQKLNLDRIRVRGLELSARWNAARTLTVTANYLYDDARVRRATSAPAIVGRRVAQVPRQSATAAAVWHAPWQFTLTPRVRWMGRQFEDDENQLILGEVAVVDFGLSRPAGKHVDVFVNVENIGDARVETGRTADGVVNIGTPRLAVFGVRGRW